MTRSASGPALEAGVITAIDTTVRAEVDAALATARNAPLADTSRPASATREALVELTTGSQFATLWRRRWSRDERVVLIGEDLRIGGVFNATPDFRVLRAGARDRHADLGDGLHGRGVRGRRDGLAAGGRDHVRGLPGLASTASRTRPRSTGTSRTNRRACHSSSGRRLEPAAVSGRSLPDADRMADEVSRVKVLAPSTPADAKGLLERCHPRRESRRRVRAQGSLSAPPLPWATYPKATS